LADHVVSVTIRAQVQQYLQGMNQIQQATQQANSEAQNLQAQGAAFEKVGNGLLGIGAAAAAGVALAVKSFADFDAQMSQVQSLSHATAGDMDLLRNAALTMGQSIGFSATEVAQAETELVKAGVSVKDILGGGLKGALNLAAAGQIDVARATEIASAALTQFGLSGKDVPHVADLLAAAADKSLGGVEELGQALQQSGLVANQFGLSIDETVGTLAEFASNGLLGSDAGTSFKSMLLQLATPSKQAAAAMKQYNIEAYDAQGNFVGITGLAGQLAAGFKGVDSASRDSALGIIFGSDAIRAANILLKDGADKNRTWINSVNEAGFAAEQAAGKTDNLNGDVKKLGAAFESGLIKTGSASNSVLREMVQSVTGLVSAYSNAPGAVQGLTLGLTAVVAATALAGGGFLTMVPKVQAARAAMQQMNLTVGRVAKGFGKGAGIAVGIAAVISGFSGIGKEASLTEGEINRLNAAMTANNGKALNQQFTGGGGAFDIINDKATSAKKALDAISGAGNERSVGFGKFFDGLTFGMTHVSDTATRFEAQFKQMGETLAGTASTDVTSAAKGFNQLLKQMGGGSDTARDLLNKMKPYKDELQALAAAQGKTVDGQELLNLAQGKGQLATVLAATSTQQQKEQLADLTGAAAEANQSISDLADQIRSFGSTQLSVEQTESDFQAAIDDATGSLKENGRTLDLNSDKGRANAAALRQIAQDGIAATAAIAENGGTQADAAAKMQTTRDAYIQAAQAFGVSGEEAAKMADQLKLVPANVKTLFSQEGASGVVDSAKAVERAAELATKKRILKVQGEVQDALQKLEATKQKLASVPPSKRTEVRAEVAAAQANLNAVLRSLNALQSRTLTVTTVNRKVEESVKAGASRGAAGAAYKAAGGPVYGAGTATSDSIPAYLSNGEYVIRAASVQKYGRHTFDRLNAGMFASGGFVSRETTDAKRAKNRFKAAQVAQRRAQSEFNKSKTAANRQRLLQAQAETRAAKAATQRADAALARAKAAPTGADLGDRLSFRTSVRNGEFDVQSGTQNLFQMGQDSSKYSAAQRRSFLRAADKNERAFLGLEKQSTKAADAVKKASDRLDGLRDSSTSMASAVKGKLSDVSYGDYRSGSSLLRGLTQRAGKLKQFQALLASLQKKGLAPALLNEIASLGVDQGLPLARSLASMNKAGLAAVNKQYQAMQSTSTKIGNQVADANFGKLIDTAEKSLSAANKNAATIAKSIDRQSKALQKMLGKYLRVPGYASGGYTGDFGTDEVAGVVHGREFVMNAAATARNRAALDAMNRGGSVRYMDSYRPAAQPVGGNTYEQHNHIQPMQHVDPNTMLTVLGREAARELAGMVS